MEPLKEYQVKIIEKKFVAQDMLNVRVERPFDFVFKAGQFVQWVVPDGGAIALRSYSLASPPHTAYLEFCVKLLPSGKASAYINKLEVGDFLVFKGPLGYFVCKEDDRTPKVFIATGAGIAPIYSMICNELENRSDQQVHLLFGLRKEEDVFWVDRFEALQNNYSFFSFNLTLSQPTDNWNGSRGRVTEHIDGFPSEASFYLCGSVEMVKDVRVLLKNRGVVTTDLHVEIF